MPLAIDAQRGRGAARLLYTAFATTGIHGRTDMPEDILPAGIERGSLMHVLFITLTVSIDYQRDADELWESSRRTWADPATRYLYSPQALAEASPAAVKRDMQKYRLSRKPDKDAYIWRTVGVSFQKKWQGDPRNFLTDCAWNAPGVLERLARDTHLFNQRKTPDFPYLRGPKIGPLWLRMLRDNAGITQITSMDRVPIPVDVHVARATLSLGIVRGRYQGSLGGVFDEVRRAWFQSVAGLDIEGRPMMALDVDEPLWHLSKYGCTHRDKLTGDCPLLERCELREFCIKGTVDINNSSVTLAT